MLSWLRRFPHDVFHRKASTGRRTSSSTSWRNKSNSFTARIIRCASTVVDAAGRQHDHGAQEDDDDASCSPSSPPPPASYNNNDQNVISARAFPFRELATSARTTSSARAASAVSTRPAYPSSATKRSRWWPSSSWIVYKKPPLLSWRTRMKIARGAAQGLEYLHDREVIYRDLKSSNILLDDHYNPRLSDFGLAKLLPTPRTDSSSSSSSSSSSQVMGAYGYCAPEYLRTGQLSAKSDVYSFGVLLLEIITGRRAIDTSRPDGEQSLVGWAAPMVGEPGRFQHELVDPRLVMAMQGPAATELNQAVGVAGMCLQEHHTLRPVMTDVVIALSFLVTHSASC